MGRRLLAVAVIAGVCAATPAIAATKHRAVPVSCHLLTDPVGDTQSVGPDDDSQLDIVGGDVAMNRTTLTTVIRLHALTAEDLTEPAGRIYEFDFTANGKNFLTMGALLPGGSEFDAYMSSSRADQGGARAATGIGQMTGVLDLQAKEIRLSGPVSMFKQYAPFSQTYLDHLVAFTYRAHGESLSGTQVGKVVDVSSSVGIEVDESYSAKRYLPYAPSCVPIGR